MRRSIRIGIPVLVIICLIGGGIFLVKQKKKELGQTPAYGARPWSSVLRCFIFCFWPCSAPLPIP